MKLVKLKVAGIRGFNDEQTLDFKANLVIYSGPNATGKTSIGEAIEWLFYGKTLKRIKGDEISKREYEGSYRNTHYHLSEDPFVEAEILDSASKSRTVRRELEIDESSKLTIDGAPANNLREFGIGALYDRPLILQHTLQDFIFMRPKMRYEVLSAMLGLEPLVDFRNAVEAAKTDFQNSLPARAVDARNRAALLLSSFRRYPLLDPVVAAIGQDKLKAAHDHLVQVALGRAPAGTLKEDALEALEQTKASKERAKLDWGRFSTSPVAQPDSHPAIRNLQSLEEPLDDFASGVAQATQQAEAAPVEPISPALRQFYQQGLPLVDASKPTLCPFCAQDSLTPERLAQLRREIEPIPSARAPLSAAQEAVGSFRSALQRHWKDVARFVPTLPSADERAVLEELAAESTGRRKDYISSCDAVGVAFEKLQNVRKPLDEGVQATIDALREGVAPAQHVPSIRAAYQEYAQAVKELPGVSNGYAANYSALDPEIKGKLASEADVQFLGVLIQGLKQWANLQISRHVEQTLNALQDLVRQARSFIEIQQKQILGLRDQEIKAWYQLLTGNADVGYAGMRPGTDNLELRARTFAKGMMAAPNLSSSQLNCVGLAVYMATCCRKGSPFKLILIDDPIQSMDDEHTEAFKKQVVKKLLDQDFQIILLTHMENFADSVERLYRGQGPLFYRLDGYTQSGPNPVWKGPEIKRLLVEVRRDKDALNPGHRNKAVQSLRQFAERFIKDFFEADTGRSISKKYEKKTWAELRELLRQCPNFDFTDEAELEDTCNFTSPFLHTDESLPQKVPAPHQLNPHYQSMNTLLDKYAARLRLT
jgi:hypothetical protein